MKKIFSQFGLLIVVLMVTFLLGEGAIRLLTLRFNVYTIEMVKYAKKLKYRHPNPEISHRHKPNSLATLMGVDLRTNRLGHRGSPVMTPSPNRLRTLVLGSSVTMGWGVEERKVFTSVLQRRLNQIKPFGKPILFEFNNAGIGNYNINQQYLLFKEQYPVLKPDFVVLHYFINDIEPSRIGRNHPVFEHSYLATYLNDWVEALTYKLSPKLDLISHYNKLYSGSEWSRVLSLVSDIKLQLDKDQVKFLVMIVPDFHRLEKGSPYADFYEKIERGFRSREVETLNLFPSFQKKFGGRESEVWIQPDDPHPNEKGHLLMANELYRYILEKKVLINKELPGLVS